MEIILVKMDITTAIRGGSQYLISMHKANWHDYFVIMLKDY